MSAHIDPDDLDALLDALPDGLARKVAQRLNEDDEEAPDYEALPSDAELVRGILEEARERYGKNLTRTDDTW